MKIAIPCCALAVVLFCCQCRLEAEEIVDPALGFRATIPDGFKLVEGYEKVAAHVYADGPIKSRDTTVFMIKGIGDTLDPSERLNANDLPRSKDFRTRLETRDWMHDGEARELQVIRQDVRIGNSFGVGYVIQFPLKLEGVELRMQGPSGRNQQIRQRLDQMVQSFVEIQRTSPPPAPKVAKTSEAAPPSVGNNKPTPRPNTPKKQVVDPSQLKHWAPDEALVAQLDERIRMGRVSFQVPTGYEMQQIDPVKAGLPPAAVDLGIELYRVQKQLPSGASSEIMVSLMPMPKNMTGETMVKQSLAGLAKKGEKQTNGKLEVGKVGGALAFRIPYLIRAETGSRGGFAMTTQTDDGWFANILVTHPLEGAEGKDALKLLGAAALTSRRHTP